MEELALILQRRATVKTKLTSERQEILKLFVDKLNEDRGTRKALSPGFISMKMVDAGMRTNGDLYTFYAECKERKNFGKYWWWSLTSKKI